MLCIFVSISNGPRSTPIIDSRYQSFAFLRNAIEAMQDLKEDEEKRLSYLPNKMFGMVSFDESKILRKIISMSFVFLQRHDLSNAVKCT